MVGMALACTLASMPLTKSLSIAIIDSNPALGSRKHIPNDSIPDPRVSTVTPATLSHFKDIGAWEYIKKHSHAFFDKMQVWDYTGLGYTRYNAKDVGREILGCVVENKVLQSSLLSRLQDAGVGERIYPAKLTSMSLQSHFPSAVDMLDIETSNYSSRTSGDPKRHGCLAKLDLSDGNTLYTKLVVGADGAKSSVRKIAGLKTTGWNYSQHAVICTVKHATENHCAWQRFLPSGPIALLPIGDTYSNIVWTMTPHEASNHKSMHEDDFVKAINHALDYGYGPHPHSNLGFIDKFSWLAGGAISSMKESFEVPPKIDQLVSERMAFPLSLMHAHEYASHRVVLIGDAAHAVHPLAGQGVNLGFGDAICLSNIIAEGILVGSDIGELSLLKKYEKERKMANLTMMAILDGFQKAFSVDLGPINLLRAAAFHGAQYIGPLKRNIISYATGEQKWPLFG
ncbi:ubiquinone biosynthesis monooxygenase COQ6, mitochondrial isoform X2 [Amborella trichopoda]|nr:ubiquinone biosynthesis monooxygenase COQ6, mitochondrial isoform X2 [Amborella trichopoda]|eukprot:XP_020529170.1 ubiquinone biosynthesis monooxygenase COQ6, mitochondrial isoform X2 [Amborella trichopoda]